MLKAQNQLIESVAAAMANIYENDPQLEDFIENHELLRIGMLAVAAKQGHITLAARGLERISQGAEELLTLVSQGSEDDEADYPDDDEEDFENEEDGEDEE